MSFTKSASRTHKRERSPLGASYTSTEVSTKWSPGCSSGDDSSTLYSLKQGDTIATTPDDIFDMLRQAWARYHESEEEVIPVELEPWLHYLPHSELVLPQLEPDHLRKAAATMGDATAAGADQWSPKELKRLPPEAWTQLAEILERVELDATWPQQMQRIWLAILAKTSLAGKPDKIRPIAILPSCYRLWAKARFQQIRPWLETVLADSMFAYRPARDAAQVGLLLSRSLEEAILKNHSWQVVSLDCTKAFPSVPRSMLWTLMTRLGLCHQGFVVLFRHSTETLMLSGD